MVDLNFNLGISGIDFQGLDSFDENGLKLELDSLISKQLGIEPDDISISFSQSYMDYNGEASGSDFFAFKVQGVDVSSADIELIESALTTRFGGDIDVGKYSDKDLVSINSVVSTVSNLKTEGLTDEEQQKVDQFKANAFNFLDKIIDPDKRVSEEEKEAILKEINKLPDSCFINPEERYNLHEMVKDLAADEVSRENGTKHTGTKATSCNGPVPFKLKKDLEGLLTDMGVREIDLPQVLDKLGSNGVGLVHIADNDDEDIAVNTELPNKKKAIKEFKKFVSTLIQENGEAFGSEGADFVWGGVAGFLGLPSGNNNAQMAAFSKAQKDTQTTDQTEIEIIASTDGSLDVAEI